MDLGRDVARAETGPSGRDNERAAVRTVGGPGADLLADALDVVRYDDRGDRARETIELGLEDRPQRRPASIRRGIASRSVRD